MKLRKFAEDLAAAAIIVATGSVAGLELMSASGLAYLAIAALLFATASVVIDAAAGKAK